MANTTLCVELWLIIFELIADDDRRHKDMHPILSVMLVCKAWKAFATPLLYRHLRFTKNHPPSAFLLHVMLCETAQYRPLHFVRSVVIHDPARVPDFRAFVASLPALVSWKSDDLGIAEVEILASTHGTRLRCLGTATTLVDHRDLSLFSSLPRFTALRELHLWFETADWFRYPNMTGIAPLCMPTLEHFWLEIEPAFDTSDEPLVVLFGRCRFDGLRRFRFYQLYEYEMTVLDEFLKYHGARLQRLDLVYINPPSFPTRYFSTLLHLGFLSHEPPSPDHPKWIPSSVCRASVEEIELEEFLANEEFFRYVISSSLSGKLQELGVEDPKFCWETMRMEPAKHLDQWVTCAANLLELGVTLRDTNGLSWITKDEAWLRLEE